MQSKIRKCSQNSVKMQPNISQNSVKIQSKFSQNAVIMQPKCSQNSVSSWSACRLKSFQSCLVTFNHFWSYFGCQKEINGHKIFKFKMRVYLSQPNHHHKVYIHTYIHFDAHCSFFCDWVYYISKAWPVYLLH